MSLKVLPAAFFCLLLTTGCRDTANVERTAASVDIVRLNEAGTIMAANTVGISGPGWGGSHRITWLIEEGTRVTAGDTLILFDGILVGIIMNTASALNIIF